MDHMRQRHGRPKPVSRGAKMTDYVEEYGLKISDVLYSFVKDRALDGTGLALDVFWKGLSDLITDLAPVNRMILDKRSDIQAKIDAWHLAHRDAPHDHEAYKAFLMDIGYLVEDNGAFQIETNNDYYNYDGYKEWNDEKDEMQCFTWSRTRKFKRLIHCNYGVERK